MSQIRILVVDDSDSMRCALRAVLGTQPDMSVVAEAAGGQEAIELALRHAPDVVLLDMVLEGMSGVEAAQRIGRAAPTARILAFSGDENEARVRRMLDAGARGYVRKMAAPDELLGAIRRVASGARYVDPALHVRLAEAPGPDQQAAGAELDPREVKVLTLVAQGYPARRIAAMLGMDPAEVEQRKALAMSRLKLATRADLARFAAARGWT